MKLPARLLSRQGDTNAQQAQARRCGNPVPRPALPCMMTPTDLVYYPDDRPGITRRRRGRGWSYTAPDGTHIDDKGERARIDALAVPPAYSDVWICPEPLGHLQATGRDARTRKQYRYHPDWTDFRARAKYDDLPAFGAALPALRRRILRDLREREPGERQFAIAALLALLDRAALRVGSPDYARRNKTFGASTLRPKHFSLDGGEIRLSYTGKGGARIRSRLRDRTLNRVLGALDDLAGPTLISWTDDAGEGHAVTAGEVNALLAEMTGQSGITAKTFRTWNGSVAALEAALSSDGPTIKALSEAASERLHNTPTIARKSYIHPDVVALTDAPDDRAALADAPEIRGLRRAEAQLCALLA
ncbi:DNA topoisomerase IB [Thalassococcus sp. BH17M4-6]|uniref:DNA topoisomerase IB n=1 Tax=Thalassococcus sp. BH17M4-6 TaxID=3413148 RepID=UPI003BD6D201